MSAKNYSVVLGYLSRFAEAHMEVKRFKSSFLSNIEPFAREDRSFPILYVTPNTINNKRYTNIYSFTVYCLDKVNAVKDNETAILTSTEQILRDLSIYLKESDNGLELDNEPNLEVLESYLFDGCIGWKATYDVSGAAFSSDCTIPFIQGFIDTPIDFNCDITYPATKYLTCDTLSGCTIIQGIESDILDLSATTQNISTLYVPYSGANNDVHLGTKEVYTGKLWLYDEVEGESGSLHYADEALHFENSDGETLMYIEPGFVQLHNGQNIQSNLFTTLLTQIRNHYLPDRDGTIALTANTLSGYGITDAYPLNSNPRGYLTAYTDTYTTGGTYSNGSAIFTNNSGRTFTVNGFTTPFTGGSVTGATNFTNGLTANTISATTYLNLPSTSGLYLPLSGGTVTGQTNIYYNAFGPTSNIFNLGLDSNNTLFTFGFANSSAQITYPYNRPANFASAPSYNFDNVTNINNSNGSGAFNFLNLGTTSSSTNFSFGYIYGQQRITYNSSSPAQFYNANFYSFDNNVGINTITNAGYNLDVNGTTRLNGNATVNGSLTSTSISSGSVSATTISATSISSGSVSAQTTSLTSLPNSTGSTSPFLLTLKSTSSVPFASNAYTNLLQTVDVNGRIGLTYANTGSLSNNNRYPVDNTSSEGFGRFALYNANMNSLSINVYYNTAIGYMALYSLTGNSYNTSIGAQSLYNNLSGANNTGLGYRSLYNVTTGSNNMAIGYNTGLGITTGSYNTILGANVGSLAAGLSNTVIIADSQGNQRITVPSTGNVLVGYGLTDAGYKLDVNGTTRLNGNATVAGLLSVNSTTASTPTLQTFSTGRVGINASASTYPLTVKGDGINDTIGGKIGILDAAGTSGLILATNIGAGNPGIQALGSQVIHIASPINGTGGNEFLTVRKANAATDIQRWDNYGGTARLASIAGDGTFNTLGNVFIGYSGNSYTGSTYKLEVNGTSNFNGNMNITGQLSTTSQINSSQGFVDTGNGISTNLIRNNNTGFKIQGTTATLYWIGFGTDASTAMSIDNTGKISARKLSLTIGASGSTGTVVLTGGTATVSNSLVTASSLIQLTTQVVGGTIGIQYISAKVAGSSFTITSSSNTDTSTVAYLITN